jgi:hypothetical protein
MILFFQQDEGKNTSIKKKLSNKNCYTKNNFFYDRNVAKE